MHRNELSRATFALGWFLSLAGCGSAGSTSVAEDAAQASSGGSGGGGTTDAGGSNGDGTTDASGGASSNAANASSQVTSSGTGGASVGNVSDTNTDGTDTNGSVGSSGGASSTATTTSGGEGPACPGFTARPDVPGTTCRSPGDCENGATCDAYPVSGCGFCLAPTRECEDDDGCAEGEHCVEFLSTETCVCFPDASECRPACTATSCGDGQECVDEICRPESCENGYACDTDFVCAPDRAGSDAHGCAPTNCNEGRPCGTGYACDSETGGCLAVHCSEGGAAACPENFECETEALGRGCVPKVCEVDADCDCGVCIDNCAGEACPPGQCAGQLYVCNLPVP